MTLPPPRHILVGTIALGVGLTLIQIGIKPLAKFPTTVSMSLPTAVSLSGWNLQSTQSIQPSQSVQKYNRIQTGQRYFYQQEDRQLQVNVRYVVQTEGDVGQFMAAQNTPPPSERVTERRSGHGFYRLSSEQNQATLQTCLTISGETTLTPTQFRQTAYKQALQPQQWLHWLTGQRSLIDRRCLWIQLATPLGQTDVEAAYHTLEQTWETLLPFWRSYLHTMD
jgi:cyanosortase A-associated protein